MAKKMVSTRSERASKRSRAYVPSVVDLTRFWGPKSRKPSIVLGQLQSHYQPIPGPIRQTATKEYVDRLRNVLEFAQHVGADFCVLPEFACPESAAKTIKRTIWQNRTASCTYILPFEHLPVASYKKLLKLFEVPASLFQQETHEIAEMAPLEDDAYVNAALIVVRQGTKSRVIPQRKLRPAQLEEWGAVDARFVKGRTLRIIQARNCTFSVMICFDFIHRDIGQRDRPRGALADFDLDLLMVPECNPQPLHHFYLISTIDFYQTPGWEQRKPVLVFNNVAAGTTLGHHKLHFGFSRFIGNLGTVTTSAELVTVDGYISRDSPRALRDLVSRPAEPVGDDRTPRTIVVDAKRTKTVIIRPEQTVVRCELPPLGLGAAEDRRASSIDTDVTLYRPLGNASAWARVREPPWQSIERRKRPRAGTTLAGASDLQKRFRELLERETLLIVKGGAGRGKTALVSTTIEDVLQSHDRLIWIDLSTIEHSETALVEEVLVRLGESGALAQTLDKQYESLRLALRVLPTILVLDSAESWGREMLERLLKLHGWKTLIIVAGRTEAVPAPVTQLVDVVAMTPRNFVELVEHAAQRKLDDPVLSILAFAMYISSDGSALVAVWTGQYLLRNPREARRLGEYIDGRYGAYLLQLRSAPEPPALTDGDESDELRKAADLEPPITMDGIYEWFASALTDSELELLDVLCEMPSGLRTDDLALIAHRSEAAIEELIEALSERNLVQTLREENDPDPKHAQHIGHPFVRELWYASHPTLEEQVWNGIVDWAAHVLDQYVPERDPRVSAININQWSNLAHVLQTLARGGTADQRRFLDLWIKADQFLWAAGRWRERLGLGLLAEKTAQQVGDVRREIVALYDAQAKTRWHRDASRKEAEELLDRAAALAERHQFDALRARIEWHRSRLLLHVGDFDAAEAAARRAVELADGARKPETDVRLTARIGLGNVYRERGNAQMAIEKYREAAALLKGRRSVQAEETLAVIERNVGRALLRGGDPAAALQHLEQAMAHFADLELVVQQAETAVDYAEALAKIGEPETAQRHLDWGRRRLDPLGSVLRKQTIDRADKAIRNAEAKRM